MADQFAVGTWLDRITCESIFSSRNRQFWRWIYATYRADSRYLRLDLAMFSKILAFRDTKRHRIGPMSQPLAVYVPKPILRDRHIGTGCSFWEWVSLHSSLLKSSRSKDGKPLASSAIINLSLSRV